MTGMFYFLGFRKKTKMKEEEKIYPDPWTLADIQAYVPRDYAPLQNLYKRKGLDQSLPAYRAAFLMDTMLRFTMSDHDAIMRHACVHGRASALNMLEDWVISNHKEFIKKATERIPDQSDC